MLFGSFPPSALAVEDRCLRVGMNLPRRAQDRRSRGGHDGTGRLRPPRRTAWSLVVRNFFVDPSGEYVDVPKDDPADLGYAVHAVNVLSALGDFCELEYHAPALGHDPRNAESTDVSQVWAFRGPHAPSAGSSPCCWASASPRTEGGVT